MTLRVRPYSNNHFNSYTLSAADFPLGRFRS